MPKSTGKYVTERTPGRFYFRIVLPADVRPYFHCSEIKRVLPSTSASMAEVVARSLAAYVTDSVAEIRRIVRKKQEQKLHNISMLLTSPSGLKAEVTIDRDDAKEEEQIASALLAAIEPQQSLPSKEKTEPERVVLSALVEAYCTEHRKAGSWTEKTSQENEAIYSCLIGLLGDITVTDVGAIEARKFKEMVQKLPPNVSKSPRYRDMPLKDVVACQHERVLSTSSVNKYLNRVGSLFLWAVRNNYVDTNPFEGLSIRRSQSASAERSRFSSDDLHALFSSQVYTALRFTHPYYYWLPLLGLFTGARIEELAKLQTADIRMENDVLVVDINRAGSTRLKTLSSERLVPVHSKLKELGIEAFVSRQKSAGHMRLFPELKSQRDGYSQAASKWFSRYRKACGVGEKEKTFHSFRHTFIDSLKQLGTVPTTVIQALAGHSNGSVTLDRYGKPYGPEPLLEAVEKLTFELPAIAHFDGDQVP